MAASKFPSTYRRPQPSSNMATRRYSDLAAFIADSTRVQKPSKNKVRSGTPFTRTVDSISAASKEINAPRLIASTTSKPFSCNFLTRPSRCELAFLRVPRPQNKQPFRAVEYDVEPQSQGGCLQILCP